jgi:hypothetical protein
MTPLQNCLQSLEVLAKADDPNCIPIIEKNIDEFPRSAGKKIPQRQDALNELDRAIRTRAWASACAAHMLKYIAWHRAAIETKGSHWNEQRFSAVS